MYCKKCGNIVEKNLNNCSICGCKLNDNSSSKIVDNKKTPWIYIIITIILLILARVFWNSFSFVFILLALLINCYGLTIYKRNNALIISIYVVVLTGAIFMFIMSAFYNTSNCISDYIDNSCDVVTSCD